MYDVMFALRKTGHLPDSCRLREGQIFVLSCLWHKSVLDSKILVIVYVLHSLKEQMFFPLSFQDEKYSEAILNCTARKYSLPFSRFLHIFCYIDYRDGDWCISVYGAIGDVAERYCS
uniref:Uncharacterized protein n=1 Tax=Schistocephalus solidus TaxID=70667 RepID=A0A0X3P173_SCHSO